MSIESDRDEGLAIRDLLVARSERHEREEHGGEPCLGDRIALISLLTHSLGLKPVHLELVADQLLEYEAEHAARHDHNGHDHGGHEHA